jgi:serine/threonine-protein kinase
VNDQSALTELAGAILDGTPIDWDVAGSSVAPADRTVVERLRAIAAIAEARGAETPDTWGPLRSLERLGHGAFGDVYRAWDSRLDRQVALKLLPPEQDSAATLATSIIQEGRLLARVRHPNVVTVYGAERIDGRVGLWMEYIDGRTLHQLVIEDGRRFSQAEVVTLGESLCRAVAAVHAAGLVHGDIKAQNVMLDRDDRVVLMDFGTGHERTTRPNARLAGTPLYLPPELLSGQVPASTHSDVYSIGVLLFFLLTGTYPVVAVDLEQLRAAHARGERRWLQSLRADLPQPLRLVIEQAIDPDPSRRYPTAAALADALRGSQTEAAAGPRAWRRISQRKAAAVAVVLLTASSGAAYLLSATGAHRGAAPIRSVMILPLDNLSSDSAQGYLASGITEGLTTELGRINSLRVVSRTTAKEYKRRATPSAQIQRELGVDAVVEGSVVRIGDRVRLTVQLIGLNPETHLWAHAYERTINDAFGLETDAAQALVAAMHVGGSSAEATHSRRRPVRADAYETYLRARYYESGAAGLATERAIDSYQKAVALDPTFTAARAGLARAFIFGVRMRPRLALATARQTAIAALQSDPDAPEALLASAITRLYYDHDFQGADREFRRAVDADPGNVDAHFYYSQCLAAMGRFDEAAAAAGRALQQDPLSPLVAHYLGRIYYFGRRYDKAIERLSAALEIDPNYAFTHIFLASTYERLHDHPRAIEHREAYLTLNEIPPDEVAALGRIARTTGYSAALRRLAAASAANAQRVGYLTSTELAMLFAQIGDVDAALIWLERAVDDHTRDLIYLNVEPAFDILRPDPRFQQLVRRTFR